MTGALRCRAQLPLTPPTVRPRGDVGKASRDFSRPLPRPSLSLPQPAVTTGSHLFHRQERNLCSTEGKTVPESPLYLERGVLHKEGRRGGHFSFWCPGLGMTSWPRIPLALRTAWTKNATCHTTKQRIPWPPSQQPLWTVYPQGNQDGEEQDTRPRR